MTNDEKIKKLCNAITEASEKSRLFLLAGQAKELKEIVEVLKSCHPSEEVDINIFLTQLASLLQVNYKLLNSENKLFEDFCRNDVNIAALDKAKVELTPSRKK